MRPENATNATDVAAHLTPEQTDRALDLRRKCWSLRRIAADLGVHHSTVGRAFARIDARALKEARLRRRAVSFKAAQLDQLEWIADEATRAWERSRLDEVTVKTTEQGPRAGDDPRGPVVLEVKTETTTKGQAGDPCLLREARNALADIRSILGIAAEDERDRRRVDLQEKALSFKTEGDGSFNLSEVTAAAEAAAQAHTPAERPPGR